MDTNAPNRPDYQHPMLDYLSPALTLCRSVWDGLYSNKETYLPKYPQEPAQAYESRVSSAVFNNLYRGLIEAIAGLLTAFDIENAPPSFDEAIEQGYGLDGNGSGWHGFFQAADSKALRDGVCYILTNNPALSPEMAEERTAADARTLPQFTLIERAQVLNWRTVNIEGQTVLTQCTLLMLADLPDGDYGVKTKPFYHVFRLVPEGVSLTVYEVTDQGKAVEQRATLAPGLERIPLVAYPDSSTPFPSKDNPILPTLLKAAQLNIKLFQQDAALFSIERKVNAPTVYRVSSLPFAQRPPVVLGENFVIELMRDSGMTSTGEDKVGVLELQGAGIAALQSSIERTKREIESEGMGFLSGGTVERTATETYFASVRASASVNAWARAKTQAIQNLIELWCFFTGEPTNATVSMDKSVLEQPLDAQEIQQLLGLWTSGAIDHETLLVLLKLGRQLPGDLSVDEVLERVQAEKAAAMPQPLALSNGVILPDDGEDENDTPDDDAPRPELG